MTERIQRILNAAGDLLDISPGKRTDDSVFVERIRNLSRQRLGDFEMVMADLRRVMIQNLDTLPDDERSRLQSTLRTDFRFDFEARLGLGGEANGDSADPNQLSLSFAD